MDVKCLKQILSSDFSDTEFIVMIDVPPALSVFLNNAPAISPIPNRFSFSLTISSA